MTHSKIRTMEEFASVSKISRPTISKYFNNPSSVRASTREKIEQALKQFDFRPNVFAINQNRRLTKNIGIVVPNLSDPFFAEIARNIEILVISEGYSPVLLGSHGDTEQEIENLENLRLLKPAGVLLAPLGRRSDPERIRPFCTDIPTVLFDANIEGIGGAFIGSDNVQSISLMVEYLCRTGKPPAFFEMMAPSNPNAFKRRMAYEMAMLELGFKPQKIQVDGEGWDFEEIGFREGTKILSRGDLPTDTVLCSNDRLAIGLLSAAYQLGLHVGLERGSDLRIAGHDDHPFAKYTCPTLTTISQDYEAIAKTSAETLFALIGSSPENPIRQETYFNGKLVMRGSA